MCSARGGPFAACLLGLSKIFELFEIEEGFHSYFQALEQAVIALRLNPGAKLEFLI